MNKISRTQWQKFGLLLLFFFALDLLTTEIGFATVPNIVELSPLLASNHPDLFLAVALKIIMVLAFLAFLLFNTNGVTARELDIVMLVITLFTVFVVFDNLITILHLRGNYYGVTISIGVFISYFVLRWWVKRIAWGYSPMTKVN